MEPKILIAIIVLVLVLVLVFKFKNNFGNVAVSTPVQNELTPSETAIKAATESVTLQQNLVNALQQQIKNINNLNVHAPELLSQTKATLISAQDQLNSAQDQLKALKQI